MKIELICASLIGKRMNVHLNFTSVVIGIILLANITGLLYPQQFGNADIVSAWMSLVSSYLTPSSLFATGLVFLIQNRTLTERKTIFVAFLASLSFLISTLFNNAEIKNIAISIFFLLAAFNIFVVYKKHVELTEQFIKYFFWTLSVWALLPVGLLLLPDLHAVFINKFENSFHGFADSRIGYGLWSSMLVILLIEKNLTFSKTSEETLRRKNIYAFLLVAAVIGIYMSQSRAAVLGLAIACLYLSSTSSKSNVQKIIDFLLIILMTSTILGSWKLFGRQEPFEVFNSTRVEIFNEYLNRILKGGILLGAGGQVSVPATKLGEVFGGQDTQAHSLVLQWFANFGVVGVFSLGIFLMCVWSELRSKIAKMMFLVFLVFSFSQPIQGTANFFSPITLIWFFTIVSIEVSSQRYLLRHSSRNNEED